MSSNPFTKRAIYFVLAHHIASIQTTSLSCFWNFLSAHRIDAEACSMKAKLEKTKFLEHSSGEGSRKTCKKTTTETSQVRRLVFLL